MRLVDQIRAEIARRGVPVPGVLEEVGAFADLSWPPCGDGANIMSRVTEDPAFTITSRTRYVALAWIIDEIRFYAARIEPGAPSWRWSGERPDQVAAIEAESEDYGLAIFATVEDAVTFTVWYLGGAPLHEIGVARIKPTTERSASKPR
jgi:hypothetical protein